MNICVKTVFSFHFSCHFLVNKWFHHRRNNHDDTNWLKGVLNETDRLLNAMRHCVICYFCSFCKFWFLGKLWLKTGIPLMLLRQGQGWIYCRGKFWNLSHSEELLPSDSYKINSGLWVHFKLKQIGSKFCHKILRNGAGSHIYNRSLLREG